MNDHGRKRDQCIIFNLALASLIFLWKWQDENSGQVTGQNGVVLRLVTFNTADQSTILSIFLNIYIYYVSYDYNHNIITMTT